MGNEEESIEAENSSNDEVWTSQEKDEEEAREELPSVIPKDPSHEIPNGGFKAWLQVLGSFLLFLNSWFVSPPLNPTPRACHLIPLPHVPF